MDSTKDILFYCDRMLSVFYTRSEGLVRYHAMRTASCINPATKNSKVQLHIRLQWWRRPNGLHSRSEDDGKKCIKRRTAGDSNESLRPTANSGWSLSHRRLGHLGHNASWPHEVGRPMVNAQTLTDKASWPAVSGQAPVLII